MNCQDIARLLVGQGISRLTGAQLSNVKQHLASCHDCASDWEIHARLIASQVPEIPAGLAARCRAAVAARSGPGGKRRKASRYILFGTVLVVAAAAAMLLLYLIGSSDRSPADAVDPGLIAPQSGEPVGKAGAPEAGGAAAVEDSDAEDADVDAEVPAQPRFTVLLMPLEHEAKDPAVRAAVEKHFAALIDQLRAIPDLRLIGPNPSAGTIEVVPNFRIKVTSMDPITVTNPAVIWIREPAPRWFAEIRVESRREADSRGFSSSSSSYGGEIDPECAASGIAGMEPCDIAGITADRIEWLRKHVFPADPSFMREQEVQRGAQYAQLSEQLGDRTLTFSLRLQALNGLTAARKKAEWDAAVVRGAIDLAAGADPGWRPYIWGMLRGVRHPELLQLLIRQLDQENDERVRLEIVATLAEDFGADPAARETLELLARSDKRQLVRQLAERALSGEEGWRKYVLATLKDQSLADLNRIEPLARMSEISGLDAMWVFLDNEEILAQLAQALSGSWSKSQQPEELTQLLSTLGSVKHPVATDILLRALSESPDVFVRTRVITALTGLHFRRSGVRAALERVAATDPVPGVRQTAVRELAQALKRENDFGPPGGPSDFR